MDPTARIRLSLGFVSIAINMIFGKDRGRKNLLSPGGIEVLYSAYFSKICMGDIAGMLDISPSSATDLVNYLEREGFVRRVQDTENRRSILVVPTEKGEEWILDTEEKLFGFLEVRMAHLSLDEQLLFADLCARFTGVYDSDSLSSSVRSLRRESGFERVPLIFRREGRLVRLEEAVDARYVSAGWEGDEMNTTPKIESRIPETCDGIQDEVTTEEYDRMQRGLRDEGHLPVHELAGCTREGDHALEIGPGPGYLGLEWLTHTEGTHLTGLEISPAMIAIAERNAREYQHSDRAAYKEGNALSMPFPDNTFDCAFSNGSMHEWENAGQVFSEILRVIRPGGVVFVSDLRRDLSPEIFGYMRDSCLEPEIRKGFETSVRASYTQEELETLLDGIGFSRLQVIAHPYGLVVSGEK
ncbi:methyltransferase domain-containing protein [Methanocalculus taiwanensis]|uniref:Methyltransferase domain-containing protein n=2 Tax=Methanocalculus taiwanensis TaxID=106207 RepID=A0ABD4TKK9_9EURY|nr:methyltransferase domain-containing protein [Methanocalculus taiwanensis]